ncbi:hypothetical protein [Pseudoalteromonas denitrificans]|uniref:Thioredoxin domain-containing protein n=1 Tax=Pseudoalteromonas denitrificans DSM 6059 TaxID=1123010 RepID=A0A1I1MCD2_9GAMM|nr:hypothetical protein [Pseudoalteromonas denitrificans]SFC82855.1 hypothetical protein SAMN02745724_02653 [Pseudoalteromonas denitrificans DSM 6059]
MKVQLLVTHTDFCIHNLECEFQSVGVDYHIDYIEDHPELVSANNIRHSPNIFVDGKLVFRHQPTTFELQDYFCN